MGKAYSCDLRTRISEHVSAGHWRRAAARRFGVSVSCAIKLVQRVAKTGSAAPARRPLSRTRVRLGPSPRRSIVCAPWPPLVTKFDEMAEVICVDPAAIDEDCSISDVSSLPARIAVTGSINETGSGLLNSGWRMRDPVTTIVSPSCALVPLARTFGPGFATVGAGWSLVCSVPPSSGVVVCASAGPLRTSAVIDTPNSNVARNFV